MRRRRRQVALDRLSRRQALLSSAAVEALEGRVLLSTSYLLNGTTLTTTTNGSSMMSTVSSPVTLTGANAQTVFTVENFAGTVSINDTGGGNVINFYAGSGTTLTVHDASPSPSSPDTLIVRAPVTQQANVALSESQITVGSDTVNYDSTVGSISLLGQLFSNGDTLTATGSTSGETINVNSSSLQLGTGPLVYYATFSSLAINASAGNDTINVNSDSIPTSINAGAGAVALNVNSNGVPLQLTGSGGADTFTVNSNSGPLTLVGGSGTNAFVVNASSSTIALDGGSAGNTYTIAGNSATMTINGAGTSNSVSINGNSGTINAYGAAGTDSFTMNSNTGNVTIHGGTGSTTYSIPAPTLAPVTIVGGASGTHALTFGGTPQHDVFTITSTTLNAGTGATVAYSHLTALTIDGNGGNDTYQINSDSTLTTIVGSSSANNTFNILSDSALITVDTGTLASTVNLGSNEPHSTGNTLTNLTGGETIVGSGLDTLNIDDSAYTIARTATLSPTQLTGIEGAITFSGLATMNIKLGSGGNTLNLTGTPSGAAVNLNAGSGANVITLGSLAPAAGGVMNNFSGNLTIVGSGADVMTVDDTGSSSTKTAVLTPSSLTGLSSAWMHYSGIATLTINLGSGGDNVTVTNTSAVTNINGGAGNDTFIVNATSNSTSITTGGGADQIDVQSISRPMTINSTGGSSIIIGSAAPALTGNLQGIQAGITVTGGGTDTLTADDSADVVSRSGALTPSLITGFGIATSGIAYTGIATLNLRMGTGGDTLNVSNTYISTVTNILAAAGANTINLSNDSDTTSINTGGGIDTINVLATSATTNINTGSGADVVNLGSAAPATTGNVDSINGNVTVISAGGATLNVGDSGNSNAKTATLTSSMLTGIAPATISYSSLSTLNVDFGSGNNSLTIASTTAAANNLNFGSGNDTVAVKSISGPTNLNTGLGANTVYVGSNGTTGNGVVAGIGATLTLTGSADQLTIDDAGDSIGRTATLAPASLTGLAPAPIDFTGVATLILNLGTAANTLNISNTITGSTTINATNGGNTINLLADSGSTTINDGGLPGSVNVQSTSASTTINAAASDVIHVGSLAPSSNGTLANISGALQINGAANVNVTLDDTGRSAPHGASMTSSTVTGLSPATIMYNTLSVLNINLGAGAQLFTVNSTASGTTTNITSQNANDTFNIRATSGPTNVNTGSGTNIVNVGSLAPAAFGVLDNIAGALAITGPGTDTLNLDDSGNTIGKTATLTPSMLTGASPAAISFTGLAALNLVLGSGADSLTVTNTAIGVATTIYTGAGSDAVLLQNDSSPTTINSGSGADHVNVRSVSAPTTVNTAAGNANTITVGSLAPLTGGVLANITAALTVNGNTTDTLNLDDSADATGKSGTLTASALTGVAPATINYAGIATLNVALGTGGNTLNITNTNSITATNVTSGGGADTVNVLATSSPTSVNVGTGANVVNVGSVAPVITTVGTLSVTGSGTLNLNNSANAIARGSVLTATTFTLGPANITYSGFAVTNINLAAFDRIAVVNTAVGDATTVNAPANNVAIVSNTSSALTINTFSGTNTVNLKGEGAQTTIVHHGASGSDTYNLGSSNPPSTGGILDNLTGAISISGNGTDTLNLDDTGNNNPKIGSLSATYLGGLGTGGVTYSGLAALNLNLGGGAYTFTISGTAAATPTNIVAGNGNNLIVLQDDSSATSIQTGSGNSTITVDNAHANTSLSVSGGANSVTIDDDSAPLSVVTGNGNDSITLGNDHATTTVNTGNGNNTVHVIDDSYATTINTGTGADTWTVDNTHAASVFNAGDGNNTIQINNDSAAVSLTAGNGANSITIADDNAPTTITAGTGNNTMTVEDDHALTTLSSGLGNDTISVLDAHAALTSINAGEGNDSITVSNAHDPIAITDGDGADVIHFLQDASTATINAGMGNDSIAVDQISGPLYVTALGGADTVSVGTAGDLVSITAGDGNDSVSVTSVTGALTIGLGAGTDSVSVGTALSTASITAGGTGLTAGNENISITSVTGAATINAGVGNDTVSVGTASNTLTINTGAGDDSISATTVDGSLSINSGGGSDAINVGSAGSTVNIQAGTSGSDDITLGSATGATTITAGGGSDTISVGTASDTLSITTVSGLDNVSVTNAIGALGIMLGDAGDTIDVQNAQSTANIQAAGAGGDSITLTSVTGAATIVAGAGNDTVSVGSAGSSLSITTGDSGLNSAPGLGAPVPGSDTINVGSVTGALTINSGGGVDQITVGTASNSVSIISTGTDTDSITSAAGPVSISAGAGSDTITVGSAGSSLSIATGNLGLNSIPDQNVGTPPQTGDDAITVGSAGSSLSITTGSASALVSPGNDTINVGSVTGALTINSGAGTDQVTVGTASNSVSITSTGTDTDSITSAAGSANIALGSGSVTVNSAGSSLTINAGSGSDVMTVGSVHGDLSIHAGDGNDTLQIGPAGANASFVLGNGTDTIALEAITGNLNVQAADGDKTLSSPRVGGDLQLTVGNGNDRLTLPLLQGNSVIQAGNGNDTIYLQQASGSLALSLGSGADTVIAGSLAPTVSGGTVDGFAQGLSLTAGGDTALTLDDSGSTEAKTINFSATAIDGLAPKAISYSGLSSLTLNLGSGNQTVAISGTSAPTTIQSGSGNDSFSIAPTSSVAGLANALSQPLQINGAGGTNTLAIDDSSGVSANSVAVTPTAITGLGATIGYSQFGSLNMKLSNSDTLVGTAINPSTTTQITGGQAALQLSGDHNGQLSLGNLTGGSISISGQLSGSLSIAGSLSRLTIAGNLSGSLSLGGSLGVLSIGGSLSGSAQINSNLGSATISSDLTGSLTVGGTISTLSIAGNDPGTITAGAVGQLTVGAAVPNSANGTLFALTQGGVYRDIRAINPDGTGASAGVFAVAYDGTLNPNPQAALAVTHAPTGTWDLTLEAPTADWLDLSGIMAAPGVGATHLRNIDIDGSLLTGLTQAQASFLKTSVTGGVQLPNDHLGVVAARDQISANSILAAGIEGLSFAEFEDASGVLYSPNNLVPNAGAGLILAGALTINPATQKPYAHLDAPTDSLVVPISAKATVGLFVVYGPAKNRTFDPRGILLFDQAASDSTIQASLSFVPGAHPQPAVNLLSFHGDGGSVNTGLAVRNISSDGALGDVQLWLGPAETLLSLTAPSVFGSIDLFGGTLVGTLQTTGGVGEANLGSIRDGQATELDLKMGRNAMIVSRGDLISHVKISGSFGGTIAAQNDIGASVGSGRTGGISVQGNVLGSARIVALGDILGDIEVGGRFAGRLAAKGSSSQGGILGNVQINDGLAPSGAIVSSGKIGDAGTGTTLSIGAGHGGLVSAAGPINRPGQSSPQVGSAPGQLLDPAATLAALWTDADGQELTFDANQPLQGLLIIDRKIGGLRSKAA